jgi:hypothetical protein
MPKAPVAGYNAVRGAIKEEPPKAVSPKIPRAKPREKQINEALNMLKAELESPAFKEAIEPKPGAEDPQEIPDDDRIRGQLSDFLKLKNVRIAELHKLAEEYNVAYFDSKLSVPLITIEKLVMRTLASYNHGLNNLELKYHIRFNEVFCALCWNERYMDHITNTLKHEMIHQWQHEVLYVEKKAPKGWHNKDFKAKAAEIGIPCVGRNMCTGTNLMQIAEEQRRLMAGEEGEDGEGEGPEAEAVPKKSRNRKWQCGCGNARTVWSTKEVKATCSDCKKDYVEVGAE